MTGLRRQLVNCRHGHVAEFGLVAPKDPARLKVHETAPEIFGLGPIDFSLVACFTRRKEIE